MLIYTVHDSPYWALDEDALPGEGAVFIREGFCWAAFVVPLVWALWHRLWLVAAGLVAASVALNAALDLLGLGEAVKVLCGLGLLVLIGFEANDLRRWTLGRRSWRQLGLVAGRSVGEAEHRFFAPPPRRPAALT